MTLTLELPLPPNMANGRGHWVAKYREQGRYLTSCDTRQLLGRVPPPPAQKMERVEIRATLYCWALNDEDNASARVKWAVDWLKTRGYIVDDKPPHCRIPTPEQVVDRKHQRLVLTLHSQHPSDF